MKENEAAFIKLYRQAKHNAKKIVHTGKCQFYIKGIALSSSRYHVKYESRSAPLSGCLGSVWSSPIPKSSKYVDHIYRLNESNNCRKLKQCKEIDIMTVCHI